MAITVSPTISKSRKNISVNFSNSNTEIILYKDNTLFQTFQNTNSMSSTVFPNLPNGSYYTIATEDGKDPSVKSNSVTVAVTQSPTAQPGAQTHSILVEGITAGAIVGLYKSSGAAVTELTVNATSHTFTNVPNGDYFVKAKNPNQEISDPSNTVTVNVQTSTTPVLEVSRRDVVVNTAYPTGTTVKLYNSSNQEIGSKVIA